MKQIIIQTEVDGRLLILEEDKGKAACKPGLYALWSTVIDDFVAFDMTKEELVEHFVAEARNSITRKVLAACHELQCGEKPYAQFTMTFEEAVNYAKGIHGEDHYEFAEPEPKKEGTDE